MDKPRKTVIVETKVTYGISVPEDWGKEDVEFYLNDSSSCSQNRLDDWNQYLTEDSRRGHCFCIFTESTYLREMVVGKDEWLRMGED
jgi:hypothetical protein